MTRTLPISEARDNLPALVEQAGRLRARFIITRHGKPDAVLMGHDEFESWLETLEVLTSREEFESIREGLADLSAGRSSSFEEVFGEPLSVKGRKKSKTV
jgi:antitoxin YefM